MSCVPLWPQAELPCCHLSHSSAVPGNRPHRVCTRSWREPPGAPLHPACPQRVSGTATKLVRPEAETKDGRGAGLLPEQGGRTALGTGQGPCLPGGPPGGSRVCPRGRRVCRESLQEAEGKSLYQERRGSTSWLSSAVVPPTLQGMRALPGHPGQGAGRPGFSGHAWVQEALTASMRSAQSWDSRCGFPRPGFPAGRGGWFREAGLGRPVCGPCPLCTCPSCTG